MLTGDLGQTAALARDDRLAEAELALFRPLKSMLAHPVADEAEVLKRLGSPVWVEDKYDGIRAQLHKLGDQVRLYSRDLHDVSNGYPEVVATAKKLKWDGILDGELLGFRDGMAMPFIALQARLGRKNPSEEIQRQVPVIYVAFDALALGPGKGKRVEPLLRESLKERRARLDALKLPEVPGMATANLLTANTAEELGTIFDAAQERGNEGLMVKDPDSIYTPGRRGYGWLKLKRPLATLDCVVVGVEVGHGKRHGVLSDYTFAVLDDRPGADGRLVTIGKAYSGLTDREIADMTDWFEAHTLQKLGRYHVVEPTIVVEIAFDVIHRSRRHDSGFALRFPRIFRLRPDKDAREIDTLSNVETLHRRLESGRRFSVQTKAGAAPPA
jgi:DNA ligase-1